MAIETVISESVFKKLVEETKAMDGYREPIGFGIARVDRGQVNAERVLQANYAVVNWGENYGSAAVFIRALVEAGTIVDFNSCEFVTTINERFVDNAMAAFAPYIAEATGDAHKNVQVIKALAAI